MFTVVFIEVGFILCYVNPVQISLHKYLLPILILSYNVYLGLVTHFFHSSFSTKILWAFTVSLTCAVGCPCDILHIVNRVITFNQQ